MHIYDGMLITQFSNTVKYSSYAWIMLIEERLQNQIWHLKVFHDTNFHDQLIQKKWSCQCQFKSVFCVVVDHVSRKCTNKWNKEAGCWYGPVICSPPFYLSVLLYFWSWVTGAVLSDKHSLIWRILDLLRSHLTKWSVWPPFCFTIIYAGQTLGEVTWHAGEWEIEDSYTY